MSKQTSSTAQRKFQRFKLEAGKYLYWIMWPAIWILLHFQKNRTRVVVKSGNRVLLLKSWLGPRNWELPGGGLKLLGEDSREGAVRELFEEVGITAKPERLEELGIFRDLSHNGLRIHAHGFLLSLNKQPEELKLHKWEIIEAEWLELDKLPAKKLDNGTQEIISRAIHVHQKV